MVDRTARAEGAGRWEGTKRMFATRPDRAVPAERRFACAVLLLSASLLGACASSAPAPAGSVRGVAVDGSGHGLPGITITLQTAAGKVVDTVVTDADGSYFFAAVAPGQYQVVTYFTGFKALSPLSAAVAAGQPTQLPPLRLVSPDGAP